MSADYRVQKCSGLPRWEVRDLRTNFFVPGDYPTQREAFIVALSLAFDDNLAKMRRPVPGALVEIHVPDVYRAGGWTKTDIEDHLRWRPVNPWIAQVRRGFALAAMPDGTVLAGVDGSKPSKERSPKDRNERFKANVRQTLDSINVEYVAPQQDSLK